MESLADAARHSDFAVLIATADDRTDIRGQSRSVARDNVIFELGLFIGALGRERAYMVVDRDDDLQLPSDLAGLTYLPYRRNSTNPRSPSQRPPSKSPRPSASWAAKRTCDRTSARPIGAMMRYSNGRLSEFAHLPEPRDGA